MSRYRTAVPQRSRLPATSARPWATKPAPLQTAVLLERPPAPTRPPPEVRTPRDRWHRTEHPDAATAWPPTLPETKAKAPPSELAKVSVVPRPPTAFRHRSPSCAGFDSRLKLPPSVSAPLDQSQQRPKHNPQILPQTPRPDVFPVQVHPALERGITTRHHLPQPGNSGHYIQPCQVFDLVSRKVVQRMRTRADQAHLSFQHVPQLRQFVQAVPSQDPSQTRDPGIAGDLEAWPRLLVLPPQTQFQLVRVAHHGAELVATKGPALISGARRGIKHPSFRIQLDHPRDQAQQGTQHHQPNSSSHRVHQPLHEQADGRLALLMQADGRLIANPVCFA